MLKEGCPAGLLACEGMCVAPGTPCGMQQGDPSLRDLAVSAGTLAPAFAPEHTMYTVTVPFTTTSVQVTPTARDPRATLDVDGAKLASGQPSRPVTVGLAPVQIAITVRAPGDAVRRYNVLVMREPAVSQGVYTYFKASNAEAEDGLGFRIAVSGDTLAVSALEDSSATGVNGNQADNSAPNSGAVYVFRWNGMAWAQEAYIKASNTEAGDFFMKIALSGDTLAVGATGESSSATGVNGNQADNSAFGSGAVYVFTRSGSVWSQQAYIKASNAEAGDQFGTSLALSGDTLAVGAVHESSSATGINGDPLDNGAEGSGAVYVFQRSGAVWTQQAYIKASNAEAYDGFGGISIALSGDTLAVESVVESSSATGINGNQADNSAFGSGAVYVFQRSGTIWTQQAYLKASNSEKGDSFGDSVSLSGGTLVVGASGEDSSATGVNGNQADNSAPGSGAVYVFQRTGAVWTQQAYIKASNAETGDIFGRVVALSGELLAVGAIGEDSNARGISGNQADNSAEWSGAVYVFQRSGSLWSQLAYLKSSNSESRDRFGDGLALSGDLLAIGANSEDSKATGVNGNQADNSIQDSGAVYGLRFPIVLPTLR